MSIKNFTLLFFFFLAGSSLIAQPANDLCSAAQTVTPDGSCVSGTTVSANDNWAGTVGCQAAGGTHPEVWYSFVSTGNSYVGTVTSSGSWSGNVEFTLVTGTCAGGFTAVGDACGASPLSINITGLTVGATYYFTVSEKGAANAGPFSVCSSTPLAPIPSNDDCSNATSLGTLPAPGTCGSGVQTGTAVVVAGTNVGATQESPYVSLTGCGMASPANSVWYSFVQPVRGYGVTINVSGGTLANPNIALWSGTTCTSLSGVNCIVGSSNTATLTVSNGMIPGQTYYIQLSGNTGESGTYNLSVNAFQDCSDCLNASSLTVSPLPVNGMYDPGQTVSFCFHIDRWTQTVNNWLHGVQMAFGPGWDLPTLTTTPPATYVSTTAFWGAGTPASCGYWSYYPGGTTSSASGVAWPAGFYFNGVYLTDIFGYPTGCTSNGVANSPGNNFGDGVPASGLIITPPANQWNFCWTIKVKTGCNPGMSLSVAVNTSGDGESGSWTSVGCTNDPAVNFTAQISCCPPTMSSTGTCAGLSNGTATATPDGAAAPYTYSWSAGGQNTQTITGLAAGTYTVTVVDVNLCTATASVTVASNANPTVAPTAVSAAICNGASTTLAANATAGSGSISTYAWSSGLAGSVSGGSVSPASNTTYTVTVTNSNTCTATGTASVTVNANPTVAPTATPSTICNGASTTLAANATAGSGSISTYAWSSGLAGNVSGGTVSPTTNTTYTVTVTNSNSCTVTGTVTVTVNAKPTVAPTATPVAICNGGSTTLAANATAGSGSISTYAWSSGLAGNVSGGTVSPTTNTTYTVTVTNSNSCTVTGTVSVTVNALPTVAPTALPTVICVGQSTTLAANATAGSGSISTYAWSSGLAGNVSGGSVSPITNTTYTVTVTNSNGCTVTASVPVTVNAKPTVAPTAAPSTICNGQSTTLAANATAGSGSISIYAWSTGLAGNVSGGNVSPATNTTYTVTITNSNSCTVTGTVSVAVNANPTVSPSATGNICNGASATLAANATAGSGSISTYGWSSGLAGNVAGGSVSPASTTTYTVTVTNSNSCTVTGSVTVTVNATPTVALTATPAVICNGGTTSLAANATAGSGSITVYTWNGGVLGNVSGGSVSPVTNTTYTVTVTNSNLCSATGAVSVTVNAKPTVAPTATPVAICNGGSTTLAANATAGSGSISTYAWSSGLGNVASGSISPTTNTTYTVTVTNSNSCTATGTVSVTVNALPTVAPTATPAVICIGQSTTLAANATAGSGSISTYAWSNGLGNVASGSVSPITNTTYTVTVTNSNSCTATGTVSVTVNAKPTVAPTVAPSVICNGQSTTLAANATAGSGSISTYAWSTGLAGNVSGGNVSPTTNTTYTVTVTNSNSCTVTGTVSVTVNANPTVAPTATPATICDGQSTTLAANAAAGSGSISTYVWSSGLGNVASGSVSPTTNTNYTVTIANSNTCTATASVSVTVNPLPSPTASNTGPYCATSTIQLNAGGGTSYSWSGPTAFANGTQNPTRANATLAMAGTYIVTVTDANGCSATATTSVVVNSSLTPVASNTGPYCVGGTVQLNVAGGNTYSWSGTSSFSDATQNPSISNATTLMSGTYNVTATDLNGCSGTASTTVVINANPTVAPTSTPAAICNGQSTTLTANATAGSGSISTYAWSSGLGNVASGSVSPTTNTTYTVTVTNSNTCTATGTVSVIVNPLPSPTASNTGPYCATSTIQLNAGGGTSYSWNGPTAFASGAQNPTRANATLAMAGTYTVTVTDANGCSATTTTTVVINSSLTPVASNTGPYCVGGTVQLNVAGGNSYSWSGPNSFSDVTPNPSISNATTLVSGTYNVTATDLNGCSGTASTTVTVNANPTVAPTATPAAICSGQSTTLAANATAGSGSISTYTWSSGLAGSISGGSVSPTTNTTYTVTVTNSNSCTVTGTVSVTVNANPTVAPTVTPTAICNGQNTTLTANATAGSGVISTYAWSSGLAGSVAVGSVSPIANTTYTVTVTNSNSCTIAGTVSVTVNANPTVAPTATPAVICNGQSTTLAANATAGSGSISTYAWSSGLAGSVAGGSVLPTANTIYTVTVTNSNLCTVTGTVSVTVNQLPIPAASNNGPLCVGTTLQLNSSGGNSYSWSGPNAYANVSQNPTIANSTITLTGTYQVTVTDLNGCSGTASTNVVINNALVPVASNTGPYCPGATVQLNVTGGNSYSWSGPLGFSDVSQNPTIVNATTTMSGTYTVTATDLNGCSGTASTSVIVNAPLVPSASNTGPYCQGGSIQLNSGGGASYTWSGPNAYSNTSQNPSIANATVAMSGTYTVTVTSAANCTAMASTSVTVIPAMVLSTTTGNVSCNGGSNGTINLTVNNGQSPYTFIWSNAATSQNLSGIPVGSYTVTVTDNAACTATTSAIISQPTALNISETHVNVLCNGAGTGSITITSTGGTSPYSFIWNDGITTQNKTNLLAGNYSLTVTDNNLCSASVSINISQPQLLTVSETHVNVLCNGANTGAITITATGGTTLLSFVWNDGVTTQNRTNLSAGIYTVTVTDNNSCSASVNANITEPSAQSVSETHIDVACGGATPGAINVTNSGGVSPYTYLWNDGATTPIRTNISAGNYSLTVTDNNACTASISVLINTGSGLTLSETHTNVLCYGGSSATITTTTTGGTSPYSFTWNDGVTTPNRTNLIAGVYTITAHDAATCSASATINITEPSSFGVSIAHTNVDCNGGSIGTITISPSGGTTPYVFVWSDGNSSQNRSFLSAGNYSVTITDNNSCTLSISTVITEPNLLSVGETHTNVLCNAATTGTINLNVAGGTSPYSYAWNDGSVLQNRTNIAASNYIVTVTDNNLCSASLSVSISEPAALAVSETHTSVLCNGGNTGSINTTTSGGITPYSYLWNDAIATPNRTNLTAGNYSVTVQDNNTCSSVLTVSITQPTALAVSETRTNVLCNGENTGSINVTVSGATSPYTFSWNDAVTTEDRSNITAGNYSVTVNDNNSCSSSLSVNINEPTALNVSETHVDVACSGGNTGSIDITVTGATSPYTYNWNDGIVIQDRTNIPNGNYSVTVIDNNSCSSSLPVTVISASGLSISETHTNATCNTFTDATINLTVLGGSPPYTYLWNDGVSTQNRNNIPAGSYTVSATDNNLCVIFLPIVITQPTPLSVSETHTNVLCTGGNSASINITPTGATSPYTFAWNDAVATEDRNNISVGSYSVTVNDNHACSSALNINITEPTAISLSETHTNVLCNGGSTAAINITATGGTSPYTYVWNDAVTTEDRSNIFAGNYSVTVNDNNACSSSLTINITEPTAISLFETHINVLCNGGNTASIDITSTGGTSPYTYLWNDTATTEDRGNLSAGNYSVTVNDNNFCSTSLNVSITQPGAISISELHTNITCNGYSDGSITLSVTGGTPGYNYNWNDAITTQNRFNLIAGNYSVTVTDANSCTATTGVVITQPAGMNLTTSFVNPTCETNNADGNITLNVTGGSLPYTYNWSNGFTGSNLINIDVGNYEVTISDANTCSVRASFTLVYQYDFSVSATPSVTINIGENTTLGYTLSGIAGNYVSVWSPSLTLSCIDCVSPVASPVITTLYQIQVTNDAGCLASDNVTVYVVPDYSVFVPNIFSPNGDGNNDVFEIYGNLKGLAFLEIQIFNRWGEKVFESNDHHFKWDGTFKGAVQNPAVFVWQLKLSFLDGHKEELRKGSVTLLR